MPCISTIGVLKSAGSHAHRWRSGASWRLLRRWCALLRTPNGWLWSGQTAHLLPPTSPQPGGGGLWSFSWTGLRRCRQEVGVIVLWVALCPLPGLLHSHPSTRPSCLVSHKQVLPCLRIVPQLPTMPPPRRDALLAASAPDVTPAPLPTIRNLTNAPSPSRDALLAALLDAAQTAAGRPIPVLCQPTAAGEPIVTQRGQALAAPAIADGGCLLWAGRTHLCDTEGFCKQTMWVVQSFTSQQSLQYDLLLSHPNILPQTPSWTSCACTS